MTQREDTPTQPVTQGPPGQDKPGGERNDTHGKAPKEGDSHRTAQPGASAGDLDSQDRIPDLRR